MKKLMTLLTIISMLVMTGDQLAMPAQADSTKSLMTELFVDKKNWDTFGDVAFIDDDPQNPLDTGAIQLWPTGRFQESTAQIARYGGEEIERPESMQLNFEFSLTEFAEGDSFDLDWRTWESGKTEFLRCSIVNKHEVEYPADYIDCRWYWRVDGVETEQSVLRHYGGYVNFANGKHYIITLAQDEYSFDYYIYDPEQLQDGSGYSVYYYPMGTELETTTEHPKFVVKSKQVANHNAAHLNLHWVIYGERDYTHTLDVKRLSQCDPAWANEKLGHSKSITICSHGCLLTSVAMVLRYYGYYQFPDGTQLNPKTLNEWLKNQPDGFVHDTYLNLLAITRLSNQLHAHYAEQGLTYPKLEYQYFKYDSHYAHFTAPIWRYQPFIAEVPGHFVVVKGATGGGYATPINDPYYEKYTDLASYPVWVSQRQFIPSFTDQSYLSINVLGQSDVMLKNDQGKTMPVIKTPIVDLESTSEAGIQYLVAKPESGDYHLWIKSSDPEAAYSIFAYNTSGEVVTYHEEMLRVDGEMSLDFHYDRDETDDNQLAVTSEQNEWTLITKDSRWSEHVFTRWTAEKLHAEEAYLELQILSKDYYERGLIPEAVYTKIQDHLTGLF